MSRCFKYPPPGYTLSTAQHEALIESAKLRFEKEHRKAEKQRKKEKQRKIEERKKRNKEEGNAMLEKSEIAEKLGSADKRRKTEVDRLDHSNLSEEHGQANGLSAPISSTDSTGNNKRRMRLSSPNDDSRYIHVSSTQLPLQKQNKFCEHQQLCATSVDADCSAQRSKSRVTRHDTPTSNADQGLGDRGLHIRSCPTSSHCEETGRKSCMKTTTTAMEREELRYKNLVEKLGPPEWPSEDDLDWLFNKNGRTVRGSPSSASGHHVCVYALPYVLP